MVKLRRGDNLKNKLDLISGLVILVFITIMNLVVGWVAFSEFFILVGGILIGYHYIKLRLSDSKGLKKVMRIVKGLLSIALVIFTTVQIVIITYPKSNTEAADYIMVLGAAVKGEVPSLSLESRLETTVKYCNEYGNNEYIIVSGGQGPGEDITEALAMKRYLVSQGISEDRIIMEDKSTSTYENFKFSKDIIAEHANKNIEEVKVKVITSDFHAFRSALIAGRVDFGPISLYTSKTRLVLIPISFTREFFALGKTIIFDK